MVPVMPNDPQRNRETALSFLRTAFDMGEPERAVDLYMGERYIQHSPAAGDGRDAFIAHAKNWQAAGGGVAEYKRVFAEDDFVIVHAKVDAGPAGNPSASFAIADFFRFEDGRIVEHWDVVQEIPAESRNANGMV